MAAIDRIGEVFTATIANSAATSSAIACGNYSTGAFQIPATFTGTTITFTVSEDGTTYDASYTAANVATSITVGTSRAYPIPAEVMAHSFFKIVSGSTEGGARSILITLKG